jgi:hypothetical protein
MSTAPHRWHIGGDVGEDLVQDDVAAVERVGGVVPHVHGWDLVHIRHQGGDDAAELCWDELLGDAALKCVDMACASACTEVSAPAAAPARMQTGDAVSCARARFTWH